MPTGTILQVSIGRGGLPKRAIPEGNITPLGLAGDDQAHPEIHGGQQQAVLLVSSEGIAELTAQGYPLYPGALGENITTTGLDRKQWRAGQRWRIGSVAIVELTKLRAPCSQLSVYGPGIQKAIYADGLALGGFYASVVQPGIVRPGDPISLLDQMV
jgi:MOSC domain-containing protein YiiM